MCGLETLEAGLESRTRVTPRHDPDRGHQRFARPRPRFRRARGRRALPAAALGRIIEARSGLRLTRPSLLRLAAMSGGNPSLRSRGLPSRASGRGRRPSRPADARRGRARPTGGPPAAPTRDALLVVAALGHPTPAVFEAATPETWAVLREGSEAGVLELAEGRVQVATHPILASLCTRTRRPSDGGPPTSRSARAAEDEVERAVHLAGGTEIPDEDVAGALGARSGRGRRARRAGTAAELAAHARRLTPPDDGEAAARRGSRLRATRGRRATGAAATSCYRADRAVARRRGCVPVRGDCS